MSHVVVIGVIGSAELQHPIIAWMLGIPSGQVMGIKIVLVVLAELLKTAASYVDELDLHLSGGQAILAAFYDILLAATGGLHHLIDRAVAVRREKTLAESDCELVKRIRLVVEVECTPVGLLTEYCGSGRDSCHKGCIFGVSNLRGALALRGARLVKLVGLVRLVKLVRLVNLVSALGT
jgi:hypothetical protein